MKKFDSGLISAKENIKEERYEAYLRFIRCSDDTLKMLLTEKESLHQFLKKTLVILLVLIILNAPLAYRIVSSQDMVEFDKPILMLGLMFLIVLTTIYIRRLFLINQIKMIKIELNRRECGISVSEIFKIGY